jgi:Protein of unknown function (DUF4235)
VDKPLSLLVSVLGGVLAGVIFKRIWKLAAGEDDAPMATDAPHLVTLVRAGAKLEKGVLSSGRTRPRSRSPRDQSGHAVHNS